MKSIYTALAIAITFMIGTYYGLQWGLATSEPVQAAEYNTPATSIPLGTARGYQPANNTVQHTYSGVKLQPSATEEE